MSKLHVPDLHIKATAHHFLEAWRHQSAPYTPGNIVDEAFDNIVAGMYGRPRQPHVAGEPRSFSPPTADLR